MTALDMTPGLAMHDITDSCISDSILGRQNFGGFAIGIGSTDCQNIGIGQLGRMMGFAFPSVLRWHIGLMPWLKEFWVSSLLAHINGVVGLRASKKVGGVDAQPVIASMANEQPFGNWSDAQDIGNAMGKGFVTVGKMPISAPATSCASPGPAGIWAARFINLSPKVLNKIRARRFVSLETGARAILTSVSFDFAFPRLEGLAAVLAYAVHPWLSRGHSASIKGDTRYLGRFLLREPAHKITGAINRKPTQRYRFPQRLQYSTVWAGGQTW